MEKDILFVSEENGFLVKAMIKSLTEAGYNVITSQPDIVEIDLIKKLPDIYIVYLEGDIKSFEGTLKYLKKKKTEEDKDRLLFLIGNPLEINTAFEVVPKTMVTASFIRPVNMQDVISKLAFFFNEEELTGGRKRILVVDDDSVMLRAMNNWFSKTYEVFMANSGMNAISFLAQQRVDLILLDYEMPVVSGLQVFEMLRSEPNTANIPVIFLTAKDDKETVMKVVSAKPDKYLLKTMPPEELVKTVDDFFHGK